MSLPADVTVVIQGPAFSPEQHALLADLTRQVETIPSGYCERSVQLPLSSTLAKVLSVRHTREEFVSAKGLMGITWTPSLSGRTGTVKLWAARFVDLKEVLEAVEAAQAEALIARHHESDEEHLEESMGSEESHSHRDYAEERMDDLIEDETERLEEASVKWPDPSLEIIFASGDANAALQAVLSSFPSVEKLNQCVESEASLAFCLKGPSSEVRAAKKEIHILFEDTLQDLCAARVTVSQEQFKALMRDNLQLVRSIQNEATVHFMLFLFDDVSCPSDLLVDLRGKRVSRRTYSFGLGTRCIKVIAKHLEGQDTQKGSRLIISYAASVVEGLEPVDLVIDPVSAEVTFTVSLHHDDTGTAVKAKVLSALQTAEAYGITDLVIIYDGNIANAPTHEHMYLILAETITKFCTAQPIYSLAQLCLCVVEEDTALTDTLLNAESKMEPGVPLSILDAVFEELDKASARTKGPPGFKTFTTDEDNDRTFLLRGTAACIPKAVDELKARFAEILKD
jgi:hypothetical protein